MACRSSWALTSGWRSTNWIWSRSRPRAYRCLQLRKVRKYIRYGDSLEFGQTDGHPSGLCGLSIVGLCPFFGSEEGCCDLFEPLKRHSVRRHSHGNLCYEHLHSVAREKVGAPVTLSSRPSSIKPFEPTVGSRRIGVTDQRRQPTTMDTYCNL